MRPDDVASLPGVSVDRADQMYAGAIVAAATMDLFDLGARDLPVGAARRRSAGASRPAVDPRALPLEACPKQSVSPCRPPRSIRGRRQAVSRQQRAWVLTASRSWSASTRSALTSPRSRPAARSTEYQSCRSDAPCLLVTQRVWGSDPRASSTAVPTWHTRSARRSSWCTRRSGGSATMPVGSSKASPTWRRKARHHVRRREHVPVAHRQT